MFVGNWFLKGISGGQKRRLSIGCELLTSPTLLFLDEPTSGLDAASAYFVMKGIRSLAEGGRTVISVIHQPSSEVFELFDKLCLLSSGKTGQRIRHVLLSGLIRLSVVYFGDAIRAIDMFQAAGLPCPDHRNPADHFLQCTNRDFDLIDNDVFDSVDSQIQALTDVYENSKYSQDLQEQCNLFSVEGERYRGPSKRSRYLERLGALTWRTFLDYIRNLGVFWMRVGMYVLISICVGTVYNDMDRTWIGIQSRAATLFFVTAFLTFMAIAAFPAYIEELQVRCNGRMAAFTIVMCAGLFKGGSEWLLSYLCLCYGINGCFIAIPISDFHFQQRLCILPGWIERQRRGLRLLCHKSLRRSAGEPLLYVQNMNR